MLSQVHGICVKSHFSIHRNLTIALTHLHHPSKVITIWADAICINQKSPRRAITAGADDGCDVYRLATGVVAFLGPEANGSEDALRLIEKVGSMVVVDFTSGFVQDSMAAQNYESLDWADMRVRL